MYIGNDLQSNNINPNRRHNNNIRQTRRNSRQNNRHSNRNHRNNIIRRISDTQSGSFLTDGMNIRASYFTENYNDSNYGNLPNYDDLPPQYTDQLDYIDQPPSYDTVCLQKIKKKSLFKRFINFFY